MGVQVAAYADEFGCILISEIFYFLLKHGAKIGPLIAGFLTAL
jgi:hypothetical protein